MTDKVDNERLDEMAPVGWETEAEWALEQRAFNWGPIWSEEETRELVNDLWRQYCFAAEPKTGVNGDPLTPAAPQAVGEVVAEGMDVHAGKLRKVAAQLAAERMQGWANPLVSDLTDVADFLDPQPKLAADVVLSAMNEPKTRKYLILRKPVSGDQSAEPIEAHGVYLNDGRFMCIAESTEEDAITQAENFYETGDYHIRPLYAHPQPAVAPVEAVADGWVLVPREPMPEMLAAWYRYKSGHRFHDEEPARDTSDYGAYRAMLAAALQAVQVSEAMVEALRSISVGRMTASDAAYVARSALGSAQNTVEPIDWGDDAILSKLEKKISGDPSKHTAMISITEANGAAVHIRKLREEVARLMSQCEDLERSVGDGFVVTDDMVKQAWITYVDASMSPLISNLEAMRAVLETAAALSEQSPSTKGVEE